MKRMTVVTLVLLLLLCLVGCGEDIPSGTADATAAPTTVVTNTAQSTPMPTPVPTPIHPNAKEYLLAKEAELDPNGDIYYVLSGFYSWDEDGGEAKTNVEAVLKIKNHAAEKEIYFSLELGKEGEENYDKRTVYSKDGFCYVTAQGKVNAKYKVEQEYGLLNNVMKPEDFYFLRNQEMLDGATISNQGGPDYFVRLNANLKSHGFYEQFVNYALEQMGYPESIKREPLYYELEYIIMDGVENEGKLDAIQVYFSTAIFPWEGSNETKSIGFSLRTALNDGDSGEAAITPPENLEDYPLLSAD